MAASQAPTSSPPATRAQTAASLAEQRRRLPDQPGVYLFRDGRGLIVRLRRSRLGLRMELSRREQRHRDRERQLAWPAGAARMRMNGLLHSCISPLSSEHPLPRALVPPGGDAAKVQQNASRHP